MRPTLTLLFITFIFGCKTNLVGSYSSIQDHRSLDLNNDSTFAYRYQWEFSHKYSSGIWKMLGKNKIALNSVVRAKEAKINVIEDPSTGNSISVTTNILNPKLYTCAFFINDLLYRNISADSLKTVLVPKEIESISLGFSGKTELPGRLLDTLFTMKYTTMEKNNRKFTITINLTDSLFNYQVFDNVPVKIIRRKMKYVDQKTSKLVILEKK